MVKSLNELEYLLDKGVAHMRFLWTLIELYKTHIDVLDRKREVEHERAKYRQTETIISFSGDGE